MAHAVGSVRHLEWVQRLERYAQSQLTVNEFCEWEGVSPATFYNWRKKKVHPGFVWIWYDFVFWMGFPCRIENCTRRFLD